MLKLVHAGSDSNANGVAALGSSLLDEIVRDGARQMLAAALQADARRRLHRVLRARG